MDTARSVPAAPRQPDGSQSITTTQPGEYEVCFVCSVIEIDWVRGERMLRCTCASRSIWQTDLERLRTFLVEK